MAVKLHSLNRRIIMSSLRSFCFEDPRYLKLGFAAEPVILKTALDTAEHRLLLFELRLESIRFLRL